MSNYMERLFKIKVGTIFPHNQHHSLTAVKFKIHIFVLTTGFQNQF